MSGVPLRVWLRALWHARPGHGAVLVTTRTGVYCSCGEALSG